MTLTLPCLGLCLNEGSRLPYDLCLKLGETSRLIPWPRGYKTTTWRWFRTLQKGVTTVAPTHSHLRTLCPRFRLQIGSTVCRFKRLPRILSHFGESETCLPQTTRQSYENLSFILRSAEQFLRFEHHKGVNYLDNCIPCTPWVTIHMQCIVCYTITTLPPFMWINCDLSEATDVFVWPRKHHGKFVKDNFGYRPSNTL